MLKVFMVVYVVANGGVGAVYDTRADMKSCELITKHWTDRQQPPPRKSGKPRLGSFLQYTFKCEEHKRKPKVTVKIEDRKLFESKCVNLGLPAQCEDLPNGDVRILTTYEVRGKRQFSIIKAKDLKNWQ